MNTLQLQLHKKVAALSAEHPMEYGVFRYLCIAAGALVVLYLYLVSASVLNVIAQKEADNHSAVLESRLGVLEGEYFALGRNITAEHAASLGLTPVSESSFVYRHSNVGVVSVSHNAI